MVYNAKSCGIFRQKTSEKKVVKNEQIFKNHLHKAFLL